MFKYINIKALYTKIRLFITQDIWIIESKKLSSNKNVLLKQGRIVLLVLKGLFDGNIQVRSAALTYRTIFSLVPLGALLFSALNFIGYQNDIKNKVLENMPAAMEGGVIRVMQYIENTNIKALGTAGFLILVWLSIRLFKEIGDTFNYIWGIKQLRPLYTRLVIYLAVIIIAPVVIILATFLTGIVSLLTQQTLVLQGLQSLLITGSKMMLIMSVFTLLYILVPNTKVNIKAAFFSGFLAGTAWFINISLFIIFQIGVSQYNALYGTFASLPLLLFWIYTSWFILLLGCELTFAMQNEHSYADEKKVQLASHRLNIQLSIAIFYIIALKFNNHRQSLSTQDCADYFNAPRRLVQDIIYKLQNASIIKEAHEAGDVTACYIPVESLDEVRPADIINVLEQTGVDNFPFVENKIMIEISELLKKKDAVLSQSELNSPFSHWIDHYSKNN